MLADRGTLQRTDRNRGGSCHQRTSRRYTQRLLGGRSQQNGVPSHVRAPQDGRFCLVPVEILPQWRSSYPDCCRHPSGRARRASVFGSPDSQHPKSLKSDERPRKSPQRPRSGTSLGPLSDSRQVAGPRTCRDTSPSAGLVIHRRRHPSKHARRLILGTATIDLTWHRYCLEAYRVASGQKPAELQRTMREIRAGPSDQLDHRLGINVAQALCPEALRRAFVQENLRWLCRDCHLGKTRFDRLLARYLRSCRMDWRAALRVWESNRQWVAVFLDPFGIEFDRKNAARPGFPSAA